MAQAVKKKRSIYFQLAAAFIIAIMSAVAVFTFLDYIVSDSIYHQIADSKYIKSRDAANIKSLQEYVTNNNISMYDEEALEKWGKESNIKFFDIYTEGEWIYTGVFANMSFLEAALNFYGEYNDYDKFYTIEFKDGKADVFLYGIYAARIDTYVLIAETAISFMVFLIIVVIAIRRIIRYICRLKEEIEILEGGNLEYQITVSGNNELTELAASLNQMRKSFLQQIENEKDLEESKHQLIAELSHDIRTPLTNLMLYLDIVKLEKYSGKEQMMQYICKASDKAEQIREISDSLFEHVTTDKYYIENRCARCSIKGALYDELSELKEYLSGYGYKIKETIEWQNVYVDINAVYIDRVMDNIASNIAKYADKSLPVEITLQQRGEYTGLVFTNGMNAAADSNQGTGIGIKSIRHMMSEMGGIVQVETGQDSFSIYIGLR